MLFRPHPSLIRQFVRPDGFLCSSSSLGVKPSQLGGLGVFAKKVFFAGDKIEACPTLPLPPASPGTGREEPREVRDFVFDMRETSAVEELKGRTWCNSESSVALRFLALGYGSLYNHARKNNAEYRARRVKVDRLATSMEEGEDGEEEEEEEEGEEARETKVFLEIVAKKKILPGEEILISYGERWWRERGSSALGGEKGEPFSTAKFREKLMEN